MFQGRKGFVVIREGAESSRKYRMSIVSYTMYLIESYDVVFFMEGLMAYW